MEFKKVIDHFIILTFYNTCSAVNK